MGRFKESFRREVYTSEDMAVRWGFPRRQKVGYLVSFLHADVKVCGLCSLPASVPCSVAPEKSVCRPQPPQVRRTFSLDTILSSYLLGQWPRDADGAFTCCTNDKATQVMTCSPKGIRMGGGGWLRRPLVYLPTLGHWNDLSWVLAAYLHHMAFQHLIFTSLVFSVNLRENEFAFHLAGGREKSIWVFQSGYEYSCVGKQELTLESLLGFQKWDLPF